MDAENFRLIASIRIRNRRGRTEIQPATVRSNSRDPVLIGALQRAHAMVDLDARHLPICLATSELEKTPQSAVQMQRLDPKAYVSKRRSIQPARSDSWLQVRTFPDRVSDAEHAGYCQRIQTTAKTVVN